MRNYEIFYHFGGKNMVANTSFSHAIVPPPSLSPTVILGSQ